jgi:hypothetical protein
MLTSTWATYFANDAARATPSAAQSPRITYIIPLGVMWPWAVRLIRPHPDRFAQESLYMYG